MTTKPIIAGYSKQPVEPARKLAVSEILKWLQSDAERRINSQGKPSFSTLPPVSPAMRKWAALYRQADRQRRTAASHLKALGVEVRDGGKLWVPYTEQSRRQGDWERQKTAQLQRVRERVVQARMDLLEVAPGKAKALLKQLQQDLKRI